MKLVVGLTGEIGSGKSYIADLFGQITSGADLMFNHIDLDKIAHNIIETDDDLQNELILKYGTCERKELGKIVFDDLEKLKDLNRLFIDPIKQKVNHIIENSSGLILINGALLVESHFFETICEGRIVVILTPVNQQLENLKKRGYDIKTMIQRSYSQYSTLRKILEIEGIFEKFKGNGFLEYIHNYRGDEEEQIESLLRKFYKILYGNHFEPHFYSRD